MATKHAPDQFRFDGYVTTEFSVRRPETDELARLLRQGQRCYLDGPRRCGKTSLVINVAEELKREVLHIDLTGVELKETLLQRVSEATERFLRQHPAVKEKLEGQEETTATIRAGIPGLIDFGLEGKKGSDHKREVTLDALLDAVAEVARAAKAVVFVDEFQAVKSSAIEHPGEVLGAFAAVSSPARTLSEVPWIFAGSNRAQMHLIFSNTVSAFYQHTHNIAIGPIPEEIIIPFLNRRLGAKVPPAVSHEIYQWTEGIPGDLQRTYSAIAGRLGNASEVTPELLTAAKKDVLLNLGNSYALTIQKINGKQPLAAQLLDAIAQKDLRSLEQLEKYCQKEGLSPVKANAALHSLLIEGLLHVGYSGLLTRPEPLIFHYLALRPAHNHRPANALLSSIQERPALLKLRSKAKAEPRARNVLVSEGEDEGSGSGMTMSRVQMRRARV